MFGTCNCPQRPVTRNGSRVCFVLDLAPVVTECAHLGRQLRRAGEHRPRVAVGAEVLARVEACARRDAEAPRADAVPHRALRLRRVLDQENAGRARGRLQLLQGRHLAIEVDRHDRPGARPEPRRHRRGIDQVVHRIAVDEHRRRASTGDRERGRDEGVGGHDHLVSRTDADGAQRQLQGRRCRSPRPRSGRRR